MKHCMDAGVQARRVSVCALTLLFFLLGADHVALPRSFANTGRVLERRRQNLLCAHRSVVLRRRGACAV